MGTSRNQWRERGSAVVVLLVLCASDVRAAVKTWVGGSSTWDNGGAWSTAGVPQSADQAYVTQFGGVVQYQNPTTPTGLLDELRIDGGVMAPPTLVMAGGTLTPTDAVIGNTNKGVMTQSGGTHTVTGANGIYLGKLAAGEGTYNLSGTGALSVQNYLWVGSQGKGTVNQSGGSVTITGLNGTVQVGTGTSGAYHLSAGSLTAGQLKLGAGNSSFNHTGGTASIGGNVELRAGAGTAAAYTMSGPASLNAGALYVGLSGGTAGFSQTGGTNTVGGFVVVGSTAYGRYTISGVSLSGADLYVGGQAQGLFQQTGGTVSSTGTLTVGASAAPVGQDIYQLDGGTVTSASASIRDSGVFEQTAGSYETGTLQVQGTGRVNLTGGKLKVTSLSMTAAATIDVNAAAMMVDYGAGSPLNTIRLRVLSGYNGGAWGGPGVTSSTAAANPAGAVGYGEASAVLGLAGGDTAPWAGYTADATSILVRYTLAGDANLDGAADFMDLVKVAQNYNAPAGKVWTDGDFTYDGAVDFADLVKLAQNYGGAVPVFSAMTGAPEGFGVEVAAAFAQVPEPAFLGFGGVVALALCGRRGERRARRRTGVVTA